MIALALVAEDPAHEFAVHRVTDGCLCAIDWIDAELLVHVREWLEFDGRGWLPWKKVAELCTARFGRNFRLSGRFDGRPGAADALAVRKVLAYLQALDRKPDVVVLARDVDGTERRAGFQQALEEPRAVQRPFQVVLALAEPEVEAWFIAVWRPDSEDAARRHEHLRGELGFDPVTGSHRLSSTSDGKRDAKRVLGLLTTGGRPAEQLFASCSLDELRSAGGENGLAAFVDDHGRALAAACGCRPPLP
ncbi:MAG: hypothetical protein FJ265_06855 [Planctomycetes bacterium]|nr:hypothetical protein [Planctomycetota bacterium]